MEDTRGRHISFFFIIIQNELHWHIYGLFRGLPVSEKLPKIPLFGSSFIHQLRLLGSQQHPQSGVVLTSFSTWGTENSLAEINLESDIFWDQKLANTCSFVGGRIIVQLEKISRAERSWTNPLHCMRFRKRCITPL